ncbi:MAG: hypothetical protein C4581_04435 [Nitrospiraceae bacterium]|nr:MAG: hypothetical protein C4581_04435 [Nitrospiraceae bacterium]
MLYKSGKRTYRKTFTMRWVIGIKFWPQDVAIGEVQNHITCAFMNPARVSQVKLIRQARLPNMGYLIQL